MSKRTIYSTKTSHRNSVFAANDDLDQDVFVESDDAIVDNLDEMSDQLDDIQDSIDEVRQDDPNIDIDNNIDNHYIAECDYCHGLFISAVIESDHTITSINGICPLCDRETEQRLGWVIKAVGDEDERTI